MRKQILVLLAIWFGCSGASLCYAEDTSSITIPEKYGSIIETHNGTNGKLIVHIQDAHANYEAQKNIANILELLIKDNNLNLVLREGTDTDKDFSYLRKEANLEVRTRAAEKLLKNATIRGEDYLTLTTGYNISLQGIEDRPLYDENRNAIWEMDKFKDEALDYIYKIALAADSLKPKIYNEGLLNIDKAKKAYDNEEVDLVKYYESLYNAAKDKSIELEEFPNFNSVIKISEMEKKIDLAKIKNGTASDEQKTLYKEYKDMLANLNINKLFKEEGLVEGAIQDSLSENDDQRGLLKVSKELSIVDKMLRVKIVPEEYNYFLENKFDFDPENWSSFLKGKADEFGVAIELPEDSYVISNNLSKIENVYTLAVERDNVFLRKSAERMETDNVQIAVLIAGGFHTPALTRLLAENDYSYVVISPRVTTPTNEGLYRAALKKD